MQEEGQTLGQAMKQIVPLAALVCLVIALTAGVGTWVALLCGIALAGGVFVAVGEHARRRCCCFLFSRAPDQT
jgi:hypothetical protein